MKKNQRYKGMQLPAATSSRQGFFKTFTRKSLGIAALSAMLLAATAQHADALQRIVSYRYDPSMGDMTGHVIAPINYYDPSEGAAVACNVQMPGYSNPGQGVHYALTDANGNTTAGMFYKFPEFEDVRVVSIAYAGNGSSVMTIQGRENGTLDAHLLALKVDRYGNVQDQYDIITSGNAGTISFPQHSLVLGDQLYICGYQEQTTGNPTDPSFYDSRQSFVTKTNLNTHQSIVRFYNTTMFGGGFIDFDGAMRLKSYYSALYVLGSGNGPTNTSAGVMNSSKSWVASIDPTTLAVTQSTYYGFNADQNASPLDVKGSYAIDMVQDMMMDAYVIVNNDLGRNRWFVTHTGLALGLQNTFAGFNAFTGVPQGHRMKASNIFAWSSNNTAPYIPRYSICGTVGSDVPLNNPSAYGTDIEYTSLGAIPSIQAFYMDPTAGLTAVTGLRGSVLGNLPGYGLGLGLNQSFWYNGNMGEWNNRSFTIQPGSYGSYPYTIGLSMMGHGRNSWGGNINGRFIGATGDGEVNGCPAWQAMAYTDLGYFNVNSQPLNTATSVGLAEEVGLVVDATPQGTIVEWECAPGFIYREAKPGTLTTTTQSPGLYPNPATDHVTVVLGQDVQEGAMAKVMMTDVTGRVVYQHESALTSPSLELALPRLTAGMYQVAVSVAGGKAVTHKLIIQ